MSRTLRLGVLVSGRGSNLEAVLAAVAAGRLKDIDPVLVISNRPGVRALEVAARYGVATRVLRRTAFAAAAARDAAIGQTLSAAEVELALLAGYDQVLRHEYFAAYGGRTINIHPSLLPRHGGRGMIGDAVHDAVLAASDRVTGVTIHEVTADLDGGPIIARAFVRIASGDDRETLARRVLATEHTLLVASLARLAQEASEPGPSVTMAAASGAPPGAEAPSRTPAPHA